LYKWIKLEDLELEIALKGICRCNRKEKRILRFKGYYDIDKLEITLDYGDLL